MTTASAFALVSALPQSFLNELRNEGGASIAFLLQQALSSSSSVRFVDEAYDRSWEKLHCGSWKHIHRVWRQAFGYASVLKAKHLALQGQAIQSLRELDMCLMMAGPYAIPHVHTMIAAVEQELQAKEESQIAESVAKKRRLNHLQQHPVVAEPILQFPLQSVCLPSLHAFYHNYMLTNTPVIITGAMASWPAMGRVNPNSAWQDLNYFRRVAGYRTVPIEVGSSYLEDDWGQQLMTVNEFIDRYLEGATDNEPVGYLAQHHLFEQIPVLRKDIMTPDYCTLEREEETDDDITINAWFGPRHTVSPLHFDPKDNLLCQVVGKKYLRLYAPSESDNLYPVDGLLSNTSQVDVENPDLTQFPRFQEATFVDCILQEGEMLYIPPRYWHSVRSLSTSFSVSFWWS